MSHDPPLAPKILFYGEVVSHITMIVMEDLKAVPIHHQSVLENDRLRSLIQPKAEEALEVLHAGGFMHGDIRSPNVLIHPTTERVYLIDFDWADKEGPARYPTDLNPKIKWIQPVLLMRNKPILKTDDTFMLQMELSCLLGDTYLVPEQGHIVALLLGKRLTSSRDEGGVDGNSNSSDRPSKRPQGAYVPTFPSKGGPADRHDGHDGDDEGPGTTSMLAQGVAAI